MIFKVRCGVMPAREPICTRCAGNRSREGKTWVMAFDEMVWGARLAVVVVDTWAVIAVGRAGRALGGISPFLSDITGS